MIIYFPLLVALIGFVMFLISKNPDPKRIGEILMLCGVLAFLLRGADKLVDVIR